ncbi:DUF1648 domain-containing protein [Variovorax terrae]|uniref:DUF1648 domain-containing protein n=1 Tax=Variovorax terrae TaxID=2923278 RepID=A0A9X1VZE1_9BURK|nr:DUF1648 domain-containing protein [Variovorax terrae]MCJ0765750.1 DUF1648 domain-containing protein [Variovorax terrae]
MQRGRALLIFLVLLAVAALFIGATGRGLPAVVASHFDASGAANGFMPRGAYLLLMLAVVVGVPLAVVVGSGRALDRPGARINLPHRDHWLAPGRREETVAFIRRQLARFGILLVVFLCYTHWLVVRANGVSPPRLPLLWFVAGLGFFLAGVLVWGLVFLRRFRL